MPINEAANRLNQLHREHPDYPLILTNKDRFEWDGKPFNAFIEDASLGEIVEGFNNRANRRIIIKGEFDVVDTLWNYYSDAEFAQLPKQEDELEEVYKSLPWKPAIIVRVIPVVKGPYANDNR